MHSIKCVVVGDGSVGKTCLLIRYANDEFPTAYIPTIFESYTVSIPIHDDTYELHLYDTAGQEEYDQLRRLAFADTDILLLCFAVDHWPSFINIREKWVPELNKFCPGVPFILVGTRIDLREDQETVQKLAAQGKSPISLAQGRKLAKELKAVKYMECSALTKENISEVFQEAISTAISSSSPTPAVKVHAAGVSYNGNSNTQNRNNNNSNSNDSAAKKDINFCCCACCRAYCNPQRCTVS